MLKMTINGSIIEIRDMNLKGGNLPSDYEDKFDVDIETEGATFETIAKYIGGGSSGRVTFQKTLRVVGEKYGVKKLYELAENTIEVHLNDIHDPNFFVSIAERAKADVAKMTAEQKLALLEQLKAEMGA